MRGNRTTGVTRRQFLGLTAAWLALPAWRPQAGGRRGYEPPFKALLASETGCRSAWAG